MICPKCLTEYQPGPTQCPDCDVPLVRQLRDEKGKKGRGPDLVTVLETADPARIAAARSLLEAEGVPYLMKGEHGGATAFQVRREEAGDARGLLARLGAAERGEDVDAGASRTEAWEVEESWDKGELPPTWPDDDR